MSMRSVLFSVLLIIMLALVCLVFGGLVDGMFRGDLGAIAIVALGLGFLFCLRLAYALAMKPGAANDSIRRGVRTIRSRLRGDLNEETAERLQHAIASFEDKLDRMEERITNLETILMERRY